MPHVTTFIDTQMIMFLKLILAVFLGGLIGTERAVLAHQSAGTRTFGIVALGACLFVITNNYVNSAFIGIGNVMPLAMPAAIVTGIGFLGGGLIIFRSDALHGVTTAGGLWMVAAIGISVGFGMYAVSIFATILTLVLFTGMWYLENRFKHWFDARQSDSQDHIHPAV